MGKTVKSQPSCITYEGPICVGIEVDPKVPDEVVEVGAEVVVEDDGVEDGSKVAGRVGVQV